MGRVKGSGKASARREESKTRIYKETPSKKLRMGNDPQNKFVGGHVILAAVNDLREMFEHFVNSARPVVREPDATEAAIAPVEVTDESYPDLAQNLKPPDVAPPTHQTLTEPVTPGGEYGPQPVKVETPSTGKTTGPEPKVESDIGELHPPQGTQYVAKNLVDSTFKNEQVSSEKTANSGSPNKDDKTNVGGNVSGRLSNFVRSIWRFVVAIIVGFLAKLWSGTMSVWRGLWRRPNVTAAILGAAANVLLAYVAFDQMRETSDMVNATKEMVSLGQQALDELRNAHPPSIEVLVKLNTSLKEATVEGDSRFVFRSGDWNRGASKSRFDMILRILGDRLIIDEKLQFQCVCYAYYDSLDRPYRRQPILDTLQIYKSGPGVPIPHPLTPKVIAAMDSLRYKYYGNIFPSSLRMEVTIDTTFTMLSNGATISGSMDYEVW